MTPQSVDAPPAQPNEASYSISLLHIYPRISTGPCNPSEPAKTWSRALQPGEDPNSFIVFDYYDEDPKSPTFGNYITGELGMTKAAATAVNIVPPNPPI